MSMFRKKNKAPVDITLDVIDLRKSLKEVIADAVSETQTLGKDTQVTLNGITVHLTPEDDPTTAIVKFEQAREEGRPRTELASIEYNIREDQRKRDQEKTHLEVDNLIKDTQLDVIDESRWQKFREDCSKDELAPLGVAYAERWGKLMQVKMAQGKKLKDIFESTSSDADNQHVPGIGYKYAVAVLGDHWEHGEELKKCVNKPPSFMNNLKDILGIDNLPNPFKKTFKPGGKN